MIPNCGTFDVVYEAENFISILYTPKYFFNWARIRIEKTLKILCINNIRPGKRLLFRFYGNLIFYFLKKHFGSNVEYSHAWSKHRTCIQENGRFSSIVFYWPWKCTETQARVKIDIMYCPYRRTVIMLIVDFFLYKTRS
mgnify:CR=1 FL=1